jgi:hypothetical protein
MFFLNKIISIVRNEGLFALSNRIISHIKWLTGHFAVQLLWKNNYGHFDNTNYQKYTLTGLPNESTFYSGEIVKWIKDIGNPNARILLAGDNRKVAALLGKAVNVVNIYTTGIIEDVDFKWNFEDKVPNIGKFNIIVSQVMLEHLIDPYKHLCDLSSLLAQNGYLIVHTVCPGYSYHRYPVDTLRFYPDWFEEVGKRLRLTVTHRRVKNNNIFYMYQS